MSANRRRVAKSPQCERDLQAIAARHRAEEAIAGFERVVSRIPEMGMAVRGKQGFYSRPFHTGDGSYLVIYTFDEETVTLVSVRSIPSSSF